MSGISKLRSYSDDIAARKAGSGGGQFYFKLQDGESAIVRFLDEGDEVQCGWAHAVQAQKFRKILCRDQDFETGQRGIGERCPGCEQGLKLVFQGAINLIWRNAPAAKRDEDNRIVRDDNDQVIIEGTADQNAVWVAGITVFEELDGLGVDYGGLTSRDFKVTRRGTEKNTKYSIRPLDPTELSESDKALAENKFDLSSYSTPPSYEDYWGTQREESKPTVVPASTSPFRPNS